MVGALICRTLFFCGIIFLKGVSSLKKTILLMSLTVSLLVMAACSSSQDSSSQLAESVQQTASQSSTSETDDAVFEAFAAGLDRLGIEYEEAVMEAEIVGAVQGIRFKLSNGQIELYVFEEGSDALKAATDNKILTLEGFGAFPAKINGKYAMMIDYMGQTDAIIELFNSLS